MDGQGAVSSCGVLGRYPKDACRAVRADFALVIQGRWLARSSIVVRKRGLGARGWDDLPENGLLGVYSLLFAEQVQG